ncbi:serine/threonine-protein kinase [Streptomyces sp. NPDC051940]|uniref:serine/threonine-protein kinase n=1 Tax=Streptomyces sp. NPDC051940 TaxID=3155675 RepID=UPI003430404B
MFEPLAAGDPRAIAGYQLTARLGAGGMGQVFLSHTPGGRPVAIKVIRPELASDPEFRRRFEQEVRAAERVQGLYTAPVIDSDTQGPTPWLATAYVAGPPLAAAVAEHGPLPEQTVLLMTAGVAEALQVIHGAGIVHRDLKPSNVLLAADGPRVIDFGIARAADATVLTSSGVIVGTPSFMSPEQAAGTAVTEATDVFALGQVAAYAAIGGPAFGEGTSHSVLYRIVHEEPDLTAVPAGLMELVTGCLAKEPQDRPTVAQILALCQAATESTVLRRPEDWLPPPVADSLPERTAPATVALLPAAPAQPPLPPTRPPLPPAPAAGALPTARRSRRLAVAVATAAALVAGALGARAVLDHERPTGTGAAGDNPPASTASTGTEDAASATPEQLETASETPSPSATPSPSTAPAVDPEPQTYRFDLPHGYALNFTDDPVKPTQDGGDISYPESTFDGAGRFEAPNGKLVLLPPSENGSLDLCRNNSQFAYSVLLTKFTKGRKVCVTTGEGHILLVENRGTAPDDSPSDFITLKVTVWRYALAAETN